MLESLGVLESVLESLGVLEKYTCVEKWAQQKVIFPFLFSSSLHVHLQTTFPDTIFCNDETVRYANVGTAIHTN